MIDIDKLDFPARLAEHVGLSKNEIAFLKRKGCLFVGQKTCVRWIRMHVAKAAGAEELAASLYASPQYSGASISDAPSSTND